MKIDNMVTIFIDIMNTVWHVLQLFDVVGLLLRDILHALVEGLTAFDVYSAWRVLDFAVAVFRLSSVLFEK